MEFAGFEEEKKDVKRAKQDFSGAEQKAIMLQKINDYLLAGGYFRARISGIAPFDKVLGGICWSLTGCNVDVDIEFKDDLNLKEKIRLSEQAIVGLEKMGCPFRLGAHQIQGLDYESLFPVIQWLVKKLNESRDDRNELTRRQALQYFRSQVKGEGQKQQELDEAALRKKNNADVLSKFAPKRRFKLKHSDEVPVTAPKRVTSVLREYDDVAAFIAKTVAARRQREAEERRLEAASKRGGQDFLIRAQTEAMRKSQAAGGGGGIGIDLDAELLGGGSGMGASGGQGLFESVGGEEGATQNFLHSSTVKMENLGVSNNPFLKQDLANRQSAKQYGAGVGGKGGAGSSKGAGARGTVRTGGGKGGQEWEEAAQEITIGDGFLQADFQRMVEKRKIASQSGASISSKASTRTGGASQTQDSKEGTNEEGDDDYGVFAETVETRRSNSIVRGANISAALVEHIEEIEEQIIDFNTKQAEINERDPAHVLAQEEERLKKRGEAVEQQLARTEEAGKAAMEKLTAVEEELAQQLAKKRKVNEKRTQLEEAEEAISLEISNKEGEEKAIVQRLVEKEKKLKEEKAKLKKKFREEKERLEKDLEKAKKRQERIDTEENKQVLRQIDQDFQQEYNELLEKKKEIAEKNKKLTILQRKIENTPSQIELRQYQRRFREVYDLINMKLEENKRYINLFNSLGETEQMLMKQSQYMKEIREGFRKSKNKKEKEILLNDLKGLLEVIKKASNDSTDTLKDLKTQKERMQAEYNQTLVKEREYYDKVRLFQEECDRNDALLAQISSSS